MYGQPWVGNRDHLMTQFGQDVRIIILVLHVTGAFWLISHAAAPNYLEGALSEVDMRLMPVLISINTGANTV